MALLDQYGKEIRSNRPITDEIATVERDPLVLDYMGKIKLNPDKVLRTEGRGSIELFEDLLRDPKVGSSLQTRRLAVIGREWEIEPASEKRQDVKISEFVEDVLKNCNYDSARQSMLSGIVTGFKPAEIMWDYSEGDVSISRIIPRKSRRFLFGLDDRLRLITQSDMIEGEELPDKKFICFVNPSDDGSPYGDGNGRMLYWPVWFKKNGIKFWAVFLDKFGSPTAIGKYPAGTSATDQAKLLDALEAIQQESAIKMPDSMVIELLEAARSGSVESYAGFCHYMDDQIAQVLLGHTGSSQSTPGKLGSEDQAGEIREDYIKADADALCECQNNSLVRWICDYNFPGIKKYPKVWIKCGEEEDLTLRADRDKIILVDMGMGKRVPETYISETYGIPLAKEGEATIDVPETVENNTPYPPLNLRGGGAAGGVNMCSCGSHHNFADTNPDQAWVDEYMARMQASLMEVKGKALDEITAWMRSLSSMPSEEEFASKVQGILSTAYGAIDTAAAGDVIATMYSSFAKSGSIKAVIAGPDLRTMGYLGELDNFYLSKWIQNPDSVSAIRNFISEHYLDNAAGLFGRTADESIQKFRDLFSQKLGDLSDSQIQRIIDTSVQRTRNWAHLEQVHKAGRKSIRIIEPTKECDFCAAMNGKIIDVSAAYDLMTKQMAMSPEEYAAGFSEPDYQPTVANIKNIVGRGMLPPYHPHCHGSIVVS